MKLKVIFALYTLSVIVKGTWWTAAVQPFILSLGSVFAAIDQDVLDIEPIQWRNLLPFINKQEETPQEKHTSDEKDDKQEGEAPESA